MLSITPTAVDHLKGLLTQQSPGAGLRVFVSPGGCSGFQYGMSMEERADEGDEVVEDGGVRVFVDPFSLMYLSGSEIDFSNALIGGGFTILNPNAEQSCSCGQSFDTAESAGEARPCST